MTTERTGRTDPTESTEPFHIQFVPGVMPGSWLRTWAQRMPEVPLSAEPIELKDQLAGLRDGTVSMCFVRLPIERDGLHLIPLYREIPVVVVAAEHPVAAHAEIDISELAAEALLQDPDEVPQWRDAATPDAVALARGREPMTVAQAIAVAAAGSGLVIVPMSVARLHHRKDVVQRPVTGVDESQVGLAWRVEDEDPRIEAFIGIVRGRTEASSRGATAPGAPVSPDGRSRDAGTRGRSTRSGDRKPGRPGKAPRQRRRRT